MAAIFQEFVLNFFRLEQSSYQVRSETILWDADPAFGNASELLPSMKTDISLRSASRTIIVDTKFYKEALQTYFDRRSIRSAHLYQLFAYLKNLEPRGGPDAQAEGILLYPAVGQALDLRYRIQSHMIAVRTLDLGRNWKELAGWCNQQMRAGRGLLGHDYDLWHCDLSLGRADLAA